MAAWFAATASSRASPVVVGWSLLNHRLGREVLVGFVVLLFVARTATGAPRGPEEAELTQHVAVLDVAL